VESTKAWGLESAALRDEGTWAACGHAAGDGHAREPYARSGPIIKAEANWKLGEAIRCAAQIMANPAALELRRMQMIPRWRREQHTTVLMILRTSCPYPHPGQLSAVAKGKRSAEKGSYHYK